MTWMARSWSGALGWGSFGYGPSEVELARARSAKEK